MTMRILTVRYPWAPGIVDLHKSPENRTRNLAGDYRGAVAIHEGRGPWTEDELVRVADLASVKVEQVPAPMPGMIIGVAELITVHHGLDCGGHCTRWAEPDRWHLRLAFPERLRNPIPWRGQLGLQTLPDTIEAQIRRQLAGGRYAS
ncbi:hypothetical protein ATK74_0832 [Propionicimonas paludicola]|uniref:ASCH domain-containing protein n=1 Tax=Propionicimonas paludicola TaxID=185243 RepID=A0A2A9CPM5_9ACTN|nr:hypothetical protein [Propionicimonas paludicola]PFG16298.1 hypothetical protein ATK74_0832 [Propionicimonas paludicola]